MKSREYQRLVAAGLDSRVMAHTLAIELRRIVERALAIGYTLEEIMDIGANGLTPL